MGDFDPCACIFSHTGAMQRLLRMLQNAQDACTDGECTDGMLDDVTDGGVTTMTIVAAWAVAATALYMMRPNALRGGNNTTNGKPSPTSPGGNNNNPGPQPPSPTA